MGDCYEEILVDGGKDTKMQLASVASMVLCILCFLIGFALFWYMTFVSLGFFALWYFTSGRVRLEYEYSYTNGQLDIDVIYSKSKRKRLATYDAEKLVVLAPKGSSRLADATRDLKLMDYTSKQGNACWEAVYLTDKGKDRILVELPNNVVNHLRTKNPRNVFLV